jgi:hypothetical protein
LKPSTLHRLLAVVTAWCITSWWDPSRLLLSDEGLYATAGFADGVHYPGRWSVFDSLSAPSAVRLTLAVGLALCIVLFVRPTKVAGIGCLAALFVCAASLNARAPFAISSAEMYLAVLLFWATIASVIGWSNHMIRAFRIQVALVYLSPLLIRFCHGGETWIDGSALRLVVDNRDGRRGPIGSIVRHLPDAVLSIATWGTLVVEALAVLLLLALAVVADRVPESLRRRVTGLVVLLHALIALVCGLWFFSAVAVIGLNAAVRLQESQKSVRHTLFVPWSIVACVVVWSFLSVSEAPAVAAGAQRNIAAYVVRGAGITQVWGVFSPNPPRVERWVEIADDKGNVVVDSRTDGERIRKLAQNVRSQPDGPLAETWLSVLCGERDSPGSALALRVVRNGELVGEVTRQCQR